MGIRCFIALPLPPPYQQALGEIAAAWKGRLRSKLTWTKEGNWHVTLSFLGQLEPEMVQAVQEALHSVSLPAFTLQAGGAGFFPPRRTPRVMWIGLRQGADECRRLAQAIEQALVPFGFPASERPFRAHLTLARIKSSGGDDWAGILKRLQERTWPGFWADRFVLYQSRLTPHGPVYTPLETYFLSTETDCRQ